MKVWSVLLSAAALLLAGESGGADFSAGFARIDITPPYGCFMPGYYSVRHGKGVLDPLEASCLAFSDGTHTALVYSVDNISLENSMVGDVRKAIGAATGVGLDFIYVASTHIHTGASLRSGKEESSLYTEEDLDKVDLYARLVRTRLADVGVEAIANLAPASLSVGRGRCPDVAFCRRYLMKDGTYRTNPGLGNPDIVAPAEPQDDEVQLVRVDRVGKKPIAIVNFQTHPDMIGGEMYSADWPGAVRRTMENAFAGGIHCFFINGAQGDSNHHAAMNPGKNLVTPRTTSKSYARAQHVGRSVAGIALTLWDVCTKVESGAVRGTMKTVRVKARSSTPEQIAEAHRIVALDRAGRRNEIKLPYPGMGEATVLAEAYRMVELEHGPEYFDMPVSAIAIGRSVAFGGFPGEPFMGYGIRTKRESPFAMTIVSCITNGSYVYLPTTKAFEQGGYEAGSSKYDPSVEERLVGGLLAALNGLHKAN